MDLQTNLVLVTGPLSWTGSSLVQSLLHGLPDSANFTQPPSGLCIRCLALPGEVFLPLAQRSSRVRVIVGDLRNPSDCDRFCDGAHGALLFHTAETVRPKRVADFYSVNRDGTAHLLDAAIKSKVRRAVVLSSSAPCGVNPHPDHLFDELSPYNPIRHHGRSKMQMEVTVKERAGRMETVVLRGAECYGWEPMGRQASFLKAVKEGKATIAAGGRAARSLTYVDNVCQAFLLAATVRAAVGETYWIADHRPYSQLEMIKTVERLLETEFSLPCARGRRRVPALVRTTAAKLDYALQSMRLFSRSINAIAHRDEPMACSAAKAERELGYHPIIELEEGMRRSIRNCLENGIRL